MINNSSSKIFVSTLKLKMFLEKSSDDIIELLRILDHPKRFEILVFLLEGHVSSFSDLLKEFELQKSALANHLSILVDKGLVIKKEKGMYQISFEGYSLINNIAQGFIQTKFREQERIVNLLKLTNSKIEYISDEELIMGLQKLDELVKIVRLPNLRVISFHALNSITPEDEAWNMVETYAKSRGLFDLPHLHQIYGFNNPNPTKNNKTYGYEFWLTIPEDYDVEPGLTIKTHPGGLYGVLSVRGVQNISESWHKLLEIIRQSPYKEILDQNCFEHHVDPYNAQHDSLLLDLYLPIEEEQK